MPVKLGAGTAVLCPYKGCGDASDVASITWSKSGARSKAKKPVRLGAGTGVPCPYKGVVGGASEVASGVAAVCDAGSSSDSGSSSGSDDWGWGEMRASDCSWEVRMASRQLFEPKALTYSCLA
jgi:hypothetical protein